MLRTTLFHLEPWDMCATIPTGTTDQRDSAKPRTRAVPSASRDGEARWTRRAASPPDLIEIEEG